jgi:hypothetical protein
MQRNMKYILAAILLISNTLYARDYYSYVQVTKEGDKQGQLSGAVVSHNNKLYVVSAAHILLYMDSNNYYVTFFSKDGIRTTVPARIQKYDHGIDTMVLTFEKPAEVSVTPYTFGDVDYNMMAKSSGYVMSRRMSNNTSPKKDYLGGAVTTQDGKLLLYCKGPCFQGMSGGPLTQQGKLIGLQSTSATAGGLYTPSNQIKEFLSR